MGRKQQERRKLKNATMTLSQDIGQTIGKGEARFGHHGRPLSYGDGYGGSSTVDIFAEFHTRTLEHKALVSRRFVTLNYVHVDYIRLKKFV